MKEPIDALYAWLTVDDGVEGVVAVRMSDTWTPLVGKSAEVLEGYRLSLTELAEECGKSLTLVRFARRETVESILPPKARA